MKVIQVVPTISDEANGPSYCVSRLSDSLCRLGVEVHLHTLAPAAEVSPCYRMHRHPAWRFPRRLGLSQTMRRALRREAATAEVIHGNSLWMMPNVYPAWAVRGTACRFILSPHGTLSPWALRRSVWRKRLMWLLGQGRAVREAHVFHASAESEYHHIRAAGLRAPVAVIPSGIDIDPQPPLAPADRRFRRLLFLGRLHPVKGVDLLLQAWHRLEGRFPDWELQIVGDGEAVHEKELKKMAEQLGVRRTHFFGSAFAARKTQQFHEADLFVLPSHSENFGVAVAEALAHGLPAIVTTGAPWSGLQTKDCGWWIEQGVDSLTDCLQSTLAFSPEQLRAKGQRGRQWMEQEFSWDRVGRMMFETYRWLLEGGTPPEWVRLD